MTRPLCVVVLTAVLALGAPERVAAEDLLQIYHEALQNDPALAAARANWEATQERVPQARAGLLPNVSLSASTNANYFGTNVDTDPRVTVNRGFALGGLTVSASQPLYRYANQVAYSQAVQQVEQADFTLASARQDLILRVATAYFDVLLAQFTVEVTESQKAAVSEQLAQAKRNFEVGVATITDTNEAQAKYDSIVAQEINARNDLENKRTALRAIIGRFPQDLKRLGPGFEPTPPSPNSLDAWVDRALTDNLNVRIARYNADIATLEIERQRAGRLPTLDLVASANAQAGSGSVNASAFNDQRQAAIGLALTVPLYQGGLIDSRVREALALQENARQNLEVARRNALFSAQTGFSGVNSAAASVKAFEQALVSAQTAYESNKTGQEVGVRTNLDVLNTQQNVFQTRRDLAQAYFNYLLGILRLKAAVGSLDEQDLADVNRRLRG
ncbi:MAG TPA: TolC family outer membrane protein [Casimicrobiaceae bacterium]|nr:TolC family outer membrane protein [Casimicrobiaceae bacterium]